MKIYRFSVRQPPTVVDFSVLPEQVGLTIGNIQRSHDPILVYGPDILSAVLTGFRQAGLAMLNETLLDARQPNFNVQPFKELLEAPLKDSYVCVRGAKPEDYKLGTRRVIDQVPILYSENLSPETYAAACVTAVRRHNNAILMDFQNRLEQFATLAYGQR